MACSTLKDNSATDCVGSSCTICFKKVSDPRLLWCIHSFCCECLEHLHTFSERKNTIECPVCGLATFLPNGKVSSLPKDVTRHGRRQRSCSACVEEGGNEEADITCSTCFVSLCDKHVAPHIVKYPAHKPDLAASTKAYPLCEQHGCAKDLLCKSCDLAVCVKCVHILFEARHHGHTIVHLSEVERSSVKDFDSTYNS